MLKVTFYGCDYNVIIPSDTRCLMNQQFLNINASTYELTHLIVASGGNLATMNVSVVSRSVLVFLVVILRVSQGGGSELVSSCELDDVNCPVVNCARGKGVATRTNSPLYIVYLLVELTMSTTTSNVLCIDKGSSSTRQRYVIEGCNNNYRSSSNSGICVFTDNEGKPDLYLNVSELENGVHDLICFNGDSEPLITTATIVGELGASELHLQIDFGTLNVIMTLRGCVSTHDVIKFYYSSYVGMDKMK